MNFFIKYRKYLTSLAIAYGILIVLLKPFINGSTFVFGVITETLFIALIIFLDIYKKD